MTFAPAPRSDIAAFMVMDVMIEAAACEARGDHVLHLEVGQPGTPAPRMAREAAKQAIDTEVLGYTLSFGIPALRERLAGHYQDWYGLNMPVERIAVTTGSSAGFVLAFLASFSPGDRVLLTDPSYPCYRNILAALGCEVVRVPTGPATRYQMTVDMLDQMPDVAGVVIASPSNPAGTVIPPGELKAIAEACHARGIRLISDEIYHGLVFEGRADTAARYSPSAIVINSFSKYFSMTGWRIGWMIVPEDLLDSVARLATNLYISPPGVSQVAALAALDAGEELEANKAVYATNRQLMLDGLPQMGLDRIAPADGAFYVYADISHLTDDSLAFSSRLLEEAGIASASGLDFDPDRGNRTIRFSYCIAQPDIEQALERLSDWLAKQN
ncbi:MAG: aminotransferase class I/II-fold pyridoxal phosphate-dependent enzyme [Alphaproteobacteria bacterium]|nr:aminotransferase class I/II-fold pyridoxal phosphate-dependent enzyme [Alphaproteobacteria bacterium]MCB9929354.1 aminotransferase class I/II-fold pyridoxal phosphate-dependent enzyme [Alphaproteobacteria bacterium]